MLITAAVMCLTANLAQAGQASAQVAADPTFTEFFADFSERRDGIHVLEARFSQVTITPDETITSSGTLLYVKPKRLIFRYKEPELVYIIDGLLTYEYDAELKQLQIFEFEDRPETEALFLGFDDDAERLREAYDIEISRPGNEKDGTTIKLTPRTADPEAAYFQYVTLQLRDEDYLPTQIHIQNDAESEVLISVSDFIINRALEPEGAQLLLPEGTDIINSGRYVETVGPEGKRVPPPMAHRPGLSETPLDPAGQAAPQEETGAP